MYIEPNVSFTPGRISMFNKVLEENGKPFRRPKENTVLPSCNKTNGDISKKAAKNVKDKVNWLVQIAKKQKVKYPNGTISSNFRIALITLTLPSPQVHSDKEIKEKCLNQFLTEMRQKYGMKNYVWKAELQKNENIHFHITTDTFVNHVKVRNIWNRITSKLGYVQAYSEKMSKMSFAEYRTLRESAGEKSEKKIRVAWASGSSEGWISPNSTDCKTVFKVKNLAAYLAKYLAKSVSKQVGQDFDEGRQKDFGGRIWYCSQSLSKLKSYVTLASNKAMDFVKCIIQSVGSRVLEFDYCRCVYFDRSKLSPEIRKYYDYILGLYAKEALNPPVL